MGSNSRRIQRISALTCRAVGTINMHSGMGACVTDSDPTLPFFCKKKRRKKSVCDTPRRSPIQLPGCDATDPRIPRIVQWDQPPDLHHPTSPSLCLPRAVCLCPPPWPHGKSPSKCESHPSKPGAGGTGDGAREWRTPSTQFSAAVFPMGVCVCMCVCVCVYVCVK